MVWLHGSPAWIPPGDWVLPAAQLGGRSRSHPNGYGPEELAWYRPDRAYVFDSGGIEPRQHIGRFAYVRSDYYLYEVEPEDLGPDGDAFAVTMESASCARARVLRCVYEPDLLTLSADLSAVAGDGGRVIVPAADVPAVNPARTSGSCCATRVLPKPPSCGKSGTTVISSSTSSATECACSSEPSRRVRDEKALSRSKLQAAAAL